MHEQLVRIEGMTCQHCVMAVQRALETVSGVTVKDVRIGLAVVAFEDTPNILQRIQEVIVSAGYRPVP
jgi:copper chaperone